MATTVRREERPEEGRPGTPVRSAAGAEALLLDVVGRHADELLRVARAHSLCADDAHDAYQRSLELFLRHGRRLRADTAQKWLFTVCKREAQAVRRARGELVGWDAADFDRMEARTTPSPEERALASDDVARSAEALRGLKPAEVQALWLRASGRSYAEIRASTGWSYTKVNRCLSEGRRAFLARYAGIEDGTECARWAGVLAALAERDAPAADLAAFRPHLRNCPGCKATLRGLRASPPPVAIVLPPVFVGPAVARGDGWPERLGLGGRWLGRLAEVLTGPLQERAAAGVVRVQGVAEAASTGKLAAVAASAAALAGSGAAVVGGPAGPGSRPEALRGAASAAAAAGRHPATPATRPRPARRRGAETGPGPSATTPSPVGTRRSPPAAARARLPSTPAATERPGEFTAIVQPSAVPRGAGPARGEFGASAATTQVARAAAPSRAALDLGRRVGPVAAGRSSRPARAGGSASGAQATRSLPAEGPAEDFEAGRAAPARTRPAPSAIAPPGSTPGTRPPAARPSALGSGPEF